MLINRSFTHAGCTLCGAVVKVDVGVDICTVKCECMKEKVIKPIPEPEADKAPIRRTVRKVADDGE